MATFMIGGTTAKLPLFWSSPLCPDVPTHFFTPADALPVDHPMCSSDAGAVILLSRVTWLRSSTS